MSGNYFNWSISQAEWLVDEIRKGLEAAALGEPYDNSDSLRNECWDRYSPETLARFKECADTLQRACAMFKRVDYLLAGDDSEDSFHRRWEEEVPKDAT